MGKLTEMMERLKAEAEEAKALREQQEREKQQQYGETLEKTRVALAPVGAVMNGVAREARQYASQCQVIEADDENGVTLRMTVKSQTIFVFMSHTKRDSVLLMGGGYPEKGIPFQLADIEGLEDNIAMWAARLLFR